MHFVPFCGYIISMFIKEQFTRLYHLLDGDMVEVDCGVRCEHYCCSAADAVKYFLPAEEDYFSSPPNLEIFDHFLFTGYRSRDGNRCACTRDARPFCCRIFPFRPIIDPDLYRVVDLTRARGAGFDTHCWVTEPLDEWKLNAIEAWQFVLSDKENLGFYARYSIFLDHARSRPYASTSSVLFDVAEKMVEMTEVDLWRASAKFFNTLGYNLNQAHQ
jgi:hypothetical protein